MDEAPTYTPAKVWQWNQENGGRFASINRPTAGATHEQELPVGEHALQLHSLATPNGVKVTVLLEELLELGHTGAEYDAYLINIGEGNQFGSGFVAINPNSILPSIGEFDKSIHPLSIIPTISTSTPRWAPSNAIANGARGVAFSDGFRERM